MTKISRRISAVVSSCVIRSFLRHSSFGLRQCFSLVNDELVPVGIAELRHPADRCLALFSIEFHAAVFELGISVIKIFHLKRDGCSFARRSPCWMTTHADGDGSKVVLNPCSIHLCARRV